MNGTTSDDDETTASLHASQDQLRALAHPLRLDIVERVGRRGTARAADLAADLSIPANSVSYHLRILARGGVIEEAPEAARDRRDRVWKLTQHSFHFSNAKQSINDPDRTDAEYVAATGATSLAAFERMRATWSTQVARQTAHPEAEDDALASLYATDLRLSRAQAEELNQLIQSTLSEYNRLNRDEQGVELPGDPDSEDAAFSYRVLWAAIAPQPTPDAPPAPETR